MEIRNSTDVLLLQIMLVILACFALSINAVESDVYCLRSIKHSLEDPEQHLSSWDFSNKTDGSICRFAGVACWNPDESRVIELRLSGMGLIGPFPMGVINCTSLQDLDLSNNELTGQLPTDVADFIPYMVLLDLSNNNLSGPIPPSMGNFTFIDVLRLNNNQLTGQIPIELTLLHRLNKLNVANNRLSGQIPNFENDLISAESFAHNRGLCGAPLSPCKNDFFFSGFAAGLPVSTILTMLIMYCCRPKLSMSNMRYYYLLMIKKIMERKHHLISRISQTVLVKENNTVESKITDMEKYIRPMSLVELKLATNDFDNKNVIGYGNMGLMYKAVFPNGLVLAVQRLHKFESFEKEFSQEIEILGKLRHVNLVPLVSFCFEMEKKFLAYKYMSNGTLHQWLHSRPQVEDMKMGWSLRLKIAIGIARGLAWLHHNNILQVAHRKINSNCILLNDKFEPKISNFGNSKILRSTNSTLSSGFSLVVPHSTQDDVYSFGILLLELVSGRERLSAETDTDSLRDTCGEELGMIDESLTGQGFDEEIFETLKIAENCVQTHIDGRTSMLQVYQAIRAIGISRNDISIDLCVDLEGHEGDV